MTYDIEDVEENQTAPYGCKTAQTDCHVELPAVFQKADSAVRSPVINLNGRPVGISPGYSLTAHHEVQSHAVEQCSL